MRKKMSKSIALMLAVSTMLTGCGGNNKNTASKDDVSVNAAEKLRYELDENTPAWKLDTKEEITELTWYVNAEWWNTEWGKDIITQKIEEDLNVRINFISGDDSTLNTLFASEQLPDMISIFDSNSQVAQKADTWATPLYELADTYDPYFKQVASEETMSWLQLDDGNTYGYADYSNTQEDYESGDIYATTAFAIRSDVYEALGKPSMGTQEEFLTVLGQIKDQFPELYPFGFNAFTVDGTGSMGDTFQDFIGVPLVDENNEFYNRNLDEDYLSWVNTFSEAYRLGYISDDSFADDGTAFEEKLKIGKYACVMLDGTPQRSGALTIFMNDNPDAAYIAIDGPQSTIGNEPTLNQAGISGWMVNYITKNCSDPAKAIQIFTYLLSDEGQILTTYGIEGVTYSITEDGLYEILPEIKEIQTADNDRYKKEYRLGEFFFFGHDKYLALGANSRTESIIQMQEWGAGKLVPHFILENTSPDAGTQEARIKSAVTTEWVTTLVNLIRSSSDEQFDSILDNYKQFLEENDYASVIDAMNVKIAENVEKLNLN